jgi:rRNA maturation protein Nop10
MKASSFRNVAQRFHIAAGLRVPKPYGDYLILDILKKSGGTAVAATDPKFSMPPPLGESRRHLRRPRRRRVAGCLPQTPRHRILQTQTTQ